MKAPSSPTKIVWILGLVSGLLGILGNFVQVEYLSEHNYLLLLIGYILLAAGTTFKGL
jgi:hypothetical protein